MKTKMDFGDFFGDRITVQVESWHNPKLHTPLSQQNTIKNCSESCFSEFYCRKSCHFLYIFRLLKKLRQISQKLALLQLKKEKKHY